MHEYSNLSSVTLPNAHVNVHATLTRFKSLEFKLSFNCSTIMAFVMIPKRLRESVARTCCTCIFVANHPVLHDITQQDDLNQIDVLLPEIFDESRDLVNWTNHFGCCCE